MEQQKSRPSITIAAIAAAIGVITIGLVITATTTVVVKPAFAISKSQGAVNGNGCQESGCPGHSLSSPGNAAKGFDEGNCEPLVGPSINGNCNGQNSAPGQVSKSPMCFDGEELGCTPKELAPGQHGK
jgi:hypothetical protein